MRNSRYPLKSIVRELDPWLQTYGVDFNILLRGEAETEMSFLKMNPTGNENRMWCFLDDQMFLRWGRRGKFISH